MTSTRHDGDTWDLASSVCATATMTAAVRAIATRADPPLIDDPFAEPLVRAVGIDLLTRLATGEDTSNDLIEQRSAPYLTDRGWTLNGTSARDLLAANNLAPVDNDDLRMGDVRYISGTHE